MRSLISILALAIAITPAALANNNPPPGSKAAVKAAARAARKQAEQAEQERKAQAKRDARAAREQARQQAYLAYQQWRADHPAEAAYQDALAEYRAAVLSQNLYNLGMSLLAPRQQPVITCTSNSFGWTTTTTCR